MANVSDRLGWTPPNPAQATIDGVDPVNLRERMEWYGKQPLQPCRAQRPLDIGFWNPMRDQTELF